MPGIVGLITKMPRDRAERELSRMVASITHEAFYSSGTWCDEKMGVYVGWSVRKGSFSDSMPLWNEEKDIAMVFSGEEYPEPGIIQRLETLGHVLDDKRSSYLVHAYEEDRTFPKTLNGLFHGLVTDRKQGAAVLFNDRYGMHRLCYHEGADAFYFAAESKAILAARPELRTPDARSLGEFVVCSCVLENRTIFKGIGVMPAGSRWLFRNGAIQDKCAYFQPKEWEDQTPLEPEAYYRELREVFSRNLDKYFNGHEKMGLALTGGLDTRMIMAWHKSLPDSLRCYTFGGMFRKSQDVRIAQRIARLCQQPHEVITVGKDFLEHFARYAERSIYLTEGGVDVYRSSDLYVSEKAREIAPVKVVGTYGSEILRQAVMFKPSSTSAGVFRNEFLPYLRQAEGTYAQARSEDPITFAAFRQSPWYHYGVLALEQTQLTVRSPYLDNDFVRTVYRQPRSKGTNDNIRLRLIGDGSRSLGRVRTDRGVVSSTWPFYSSISRGVHEFSFKAEYACDYGMPQWLTRMDNAFSAVHFDRLFLGRHKLLHYRLWYKNALAKYVREMLLDPLATSRPYIERKSLEAIVEGHLSGRENHTTELHKLLTLELLQRLFFDPQ